MLIFRTIVLVIFGVSAVRLFGQIYQTHWLHKDYQSQINLCEVKLKDLKLRLALLEERTLAFASCGEATEYAARYDFGLKNNNETYVIFSRELDQDLQ